MKLRVLLVVGLLAGLLIYWLGLAGPATVKPVFIGGELLPEESVKVSGIDFYDTIRNCWPIKPLIELAERRVFDFYQIGGRIIQTIADWLSWLHNGLLPTYLAWFFVGALIVALLVLR